MTIRAPIGATAHAVERYIERHRPGWSVDDARAELLREAATAVFHEQPAGEEAVWRCKSGRLLGVRGDGEIATVLPAGARRTNRRPRR